MKKISVLFVFLTLLLTFTVITNSVEGIELNPAYIALESHQCNFNIDKGIAALAGDAKCSNCYKVKLTLYLQRYANNSWVNIDSWSGNKDIYSYVNETSTVSSGYTYRVKSVAIVYDKNNKIIEESTLYSKTIDY
jgi:hypothetical protein